MPRLLLNGGFMGIEKKAFLVCDRCGGRIEVDEGSVMFDVVDKHWDGPASETGRCVPSARRSTRSWSRATRSRSTTT